MGGKCSNSCRQAQHPSTTYILHKIEATLVIHRKCAENSLSKVRTWPSNDYCSISTIQHYLSQETLKGTLQTLPPPYRQYCISKLKKKLVYFKFSGCLIPQTSSHVLLRADIHHPQLQIKGIRTSFTSLTTTLKCRIWTPPTRPQTSQHKS